MINGTVTVKTFDTLKIEVVPTQVEFRRKINFVFIEKVIYESVKATEEEGGAEEGQSLTDAKRSKKKKKIAHQ